MTDKERLVETMKNSLHRYIGEYYTLAENLADDILADGWIRPPCKVGDKVYRIVEMGTGITSKIRAIRKKAETTGIIQPCEPTIKRFIRCVTVTKNNIIDCCENYGKTVFSSREEAEKVLKGDGDNA